MAHTARLGRCSYLSLSCSKYLHRKALWSYIIPKLYVRGIASHTYVHQESAISVLPTNVDENSPQYKQNAHQYGEIMARMNELHAKIEKGGSAKAREKHIARGKMLPREYGAIFLANLEISNADI